MVATKDHCIYCFDVLAAHLEDRDHMKPNFEDDAHPLFVTWNIVGKNRSQLRGCIGNFNPQRLHSGLKEYALSSALRDRRFSPIAAHEIAYLTCRYMLFRNPLYKPSEVKVPRSLSALLETTPLTLLPGGGEGVLLSSSVSLLTDFAKADDYLDWEVGTHGIWIEFTDDHGRKRTATYLPDVMPEQGWTKMEAIGSLVRKGGLKGSLTQEIKESIVLTRYKSAKCKISYQEYAAHVQTLSATTGALSELSMSSVALTPTISHRIVKRENSVEMGSEITTKRFDRGRR